MRLRSRAIRPFLRIDRIVDAQKVNHGQKPGYLWYTTLMKEFTITKNDAGQRLDRFVTKAVPLLPSSLAQKYIRKKRIKVNGKRADGRQLLLEGDVIALYINDEFFQTPDRENAYLTVTRPALTIVYEDENLLLVDKPPGLLCHSAGGDPRDTLLSHVRAYLYQKGDWQPGQSHTFAPALCNRIDRNTGGLVIAAKNAPALQILNEKIRTREIDKDYLCLVHGRPHPAAGTLTGFLTKDAGKNKVSVGSGPAPDAKAAVTRYRVLDARNGLSLLECRILTGRSHQIRAQLAGLGHPLLGDIKYGGPAINRPYGETAQALRAFRLTFRFETDAGALAYLTGRTVTVSSVDFVEKYGFHIDF